MYLNKKKKKKKSRIIYVQEKVFEVCAIYFNY